jgi:hypothetical protein
LRFPGIHIKSAADILKTDYRPSKSVADREQTIPKYPPEICMQTLNNPFSSAEKNLEKSVGILQESF